MNRFRLLVREIHRRSLWQVLGIYAFGSWLAYQVVLGLTDGLGLPHWVPAVAFVLFIMGLPMVIATAIIQEGGPSPESLRRGGASSDTTSPPDPASDGEPDAPRGREDAKTERTPRQALQGTLTWHRMLLVGVLAFALLGVGATIWVAMRAMGMAPIGSLLAAGVVEPGGQIVIADFSSSSGDSILAAVVTDAFRIDFSRSTLVRPLPPATVQDVLRRMGRDRTGRVDADLAREVALRAGIGAVVTGEIAAAGGGYVLSAAVVVAATGEAVAAVRETARDSTQIIEAIDRLSRGLRERTGESLRTIRRAEPLEQVTTSSLAALQRYTEGRRAQTFEGNVRKSRVLFEEAIAIDSTFASAHRALAVFHFNNENYEEAVASIDRALRFRDRLTDEERAYTIGNSHLFRREYRDVIAVYEPLLSRRPDDMTALTGLGIAYKALGDFERSERYMRRAAEADTLRFFGFANLGEGLVLLGRFDEASEAFDRATRLAGDPSWSMTHTAYLPWVQGQPDSAEAALRRLAADPAMSALVQDRARGRLVFVLEARGRFAEADRIYSDLTPNAESYERWLLVRDAERALFISTDMLGARSRIRRLEGALTATSPTAPLLVLAELCAWIGDLQCARAHIERAGYAGALAAWAPPEALAARAALAAAEGDPATAVRLYRRSSSWRCLACKDAMIGRIFEQAGQPDSAVAAYQRFLSTPAMHRYYSDALAAPTMERLALLLEDRNDNQGARYWYARLIEIWRDAEPALQPRVKAARARVPALRSDS
jgi:eukaryotic-like serine/threonine-protein kinase